MTSLIDARRALTPATPAREKISTPERVSILVPMLRSELFRLRKRSLWWIYLLINVVSVVTFYAVASVIAMVGDDTGDGAGSWIRPERMLEGAGQVSFILVVLTVVVFSCGSIGNEFSWGTLRPLVARAGNRASLLTAKWLSVFYLLVVFLLVGFFTCVAASLVATGVVHREFGLDLALIENWVVGFLRLTVALMPYATIGFFATMATRSTVGGISIVIAMSILEPLGWELLQVFTDALDPVRKFGLDLPVTRLTSFYHADTRILSFGDGLGYGTVCLVWTALAVIGSYIIFLRRDVTA